MSYKLVMSSPTQQQINRILKGMKEKSPVKIIVKKNHMSGGKYPLMLSQKQITDMGKKFSKNLGYGLNLNKKQLKDSMLMSQRSGVEGSGWVKDIWNFVKGPAKSAAKNALSAYVSPMGAEPIVEESSNFIDKAVDWLDDKLTPGKQYTKAEKAAILKKEKIRQEKEMADMKKRVAETMSKRRAAKAAKVVKSAKVELPEESLGPAQLDEEGELSKLDGNGIIPFGGMMQECECQACGGSGFILRSLTNAIQKNLMPRRPQGPPPRMMRGMRRGGQVENVGRESGPAQLF